MTPVVNLDAHATTRMSPEVLETVCRVMSSGYGNSSSDHPLGRASREVVEAARAEVAALVGCDSDEIIFTPGATEAINLAIRGFLRFQFRRGTAVGALVTTRTEHRALLEAVERSRQDHGISVRIAECGRQGRLEPSVLEEFLRQEVSLICLSHANGEIGTVNPAEEIGRLIRSRSQAGYFLDASQSAGYLPIDVNRIHADFLVVSAHKMHGPRGVAALFVRRGIELDPVVCGGGQERGLWPGTPNEALIAGFGVAARLARDRREERWRRVSVLRTIFWQSLQSGGSGISLNGHPEERLPGNLSITVAGVPANRLVQVEGLALSAGSACSSRRREPSLVLRAIGLSEREALCTVRIGLSEELTEADAQRAGVLLAENIRRIRGEKRTEEDRFRTDE